MLAHVGLVGVLWFLIAEVSERHWLGSALTFLPRLPWLLPGLVLCVTSAWTWSRTFWFNASALLFSLVTIGGFNVPTAALFGSPITDVESTSPQTVRVVSCNVQGFEPDFSLLLREIAHTRPDVVVFQEAFQPPKLLYEHFADWHAVKTQSYWIGSRWPVSLVGQCQSEVYHREIGIAAEVAAPMGSFVVADLHLMTARKSLIRLKSKGILTGASQDRVNSTLVERQIEANDARVFVTRYSRHRPVIVCGDFNMPTSSSILRTSFGEFTNTFDAVAWGFGHTAPCRSISFWPSNTPWQRIDHILTNSAWQVTACQIGQFDGSDHRLISATLRFQADANGLLKSDTDTDAAPDLSDEIQQLLQ